MPEFFNIIGRKNILPIFFSSEGGARARPAPSLLPVSYASAHG